MSSVPFDLQIVKESRTKNQKQPAHVIDKIIKKFGPDVFLGGVLIVGLGYRDWVKESYKSGALELKEEITKVFGSGCEVAVFDPLFSYEEIIDNGFTVIHQDFEPSLVVVNSASFRYVPEELTNFLDRSKLIFLGRGDDARFEKWLGKSLTMY